MSFFMWGLAGVSILIVLFWVFGTFLVEKDKTDACKYLAEKGRQKDH